METLTLLCGWRYSTRQEKDLAMKWLVLLGTVIVIVVIAIVRRMMLERQPKPAPPVWDSRHPLPFEQFYDRYYAESGLSEAVVFKLVEFISLSSGVDYKLILPDDPLDNFPKGSLRKHVVEFAEIMVRATRGAAPRSGIYFDPRIETVDDFIRKLGPLAERVEEQQRQLHHS
jgi:hypothetical protein